MANLYAMEFLLRVYSVESRVQSVLKVTEYKQ